MRLACLPEATDRALLVFTPWRGPLRAYDTNGKHLWSYGEGQGIDDVWASDLDGDGAEEVIIGYNGFTGLHVLDATGKLLWESNSIGNVWHVCAGDVFHAGKPQVVATSAVGQVHIFEADGTSRKDLVPGFYASMVRVGKVVDGGSPAVILVAGSPLGGHEDQPGARLAALKGDGTSGWSLAVPGGAEPAVDLANVALRRPWLALGMQGGGVHVVDVLKGEIMASLRGQGQFVDVSWAADEDSAEPLLLVANGSVVTAFRLSQRH